MHRLSSFGGLEGLRLPNGLKMKAACGAGRLVRDWCMVVVSGRYI